MNDWFYSFADYIEEEWEEIDFIEKLYAIIAYEKSRALVSKNLIKWTEEFLTTKLIIYLPKLCYRYSKAYLMGGVGDNCFTESENSTLSRDSCGPKPLYKVHSSTEKIKNHTDGRMKRIRIHAFDALNRTWLRRDNEDFVESNQRLLSSIMTDYANKESGNEFRLAQDYCHTLVSTDDASETRTYFVRHKHNLHENTGSRKPKYARTRTVTVTRTMWKGKPYDVFRCTCCKFYTSQMTCRHIYHLTSCLPTENDVFPHHLKQYEAFYGDEDKPHMKLICDYRTSRLEFFGGMCYEVVGDVEKINPIPGSHSADMEWFMAAHGQVCDMNPLWKNGISGLVGSDFVIPSHSGKSRKRQNKQSGFTRHVKQFESVVSMACTEEQHNYIAEQLAQMLQQVMSMGSNRSEASRSGGMSSLNRVSKSPKTKRQRPYNSPSKFKKG